jgi:hypothetical protein
MNAERLMMIASIVGFLGTLYWVQSRELRERYAIGWLITAAIMLLCGLFPQLLMKPAEAWRLSYSAMVLFVVLSGLYVFLFFVSVALSRQHHRNVRLTQELAHCQYRLRQLDDTIRALRENKTTSLAEKGVRPR